MAKFLDLSGLSHAIDKIKGWANGRINSEVTIKVVKLNGTPLNPDTGKAINIDLAKYAIKTEVTQEIAQAVSGIKGFDAQVVESLPQTGEKGILYLVTNSGSGQNIYDEYLWVNGKYEKLGTREIDMTEYAKKSELPTKTSQLTNDSGFLTSVPAEYVTETELTGKGYQTGAQVTQAITNATNDMATNTGVDKKLEGYALKTEIPTVESITNSEIDSLFT